MVSSPFYSFLGYRDPAYAAADLRRMCARGDIGPQQAREIIQHLRARGQFAGPLSPSQRTLLAVLTRAALLRPRLVVDNTGATPTAAQCCADAPETVVPGYVVPE
jgi:hypothetical protein